MFDVHKFPFFDQTGRCFGRRLGYNLTPETHLNDYTINLLPLLGPLRLSGVLIEAQILYG
ncbi:MAG: hypothetical protein P8X90_33625 [Desulfobacterales bacterium]